MIKTTGMPMLRVTTTRRIPSRLVAACACSVLQIGSIIYTGSRAAEATPPDTALQEVVVVGHYEFLSADTSGATNLPLPIEKVPQSISLVSADFIKAADLKTLGDIAQYTPGALNVGNQEGFGTIVKLRGFASIQAFDGLNVGVLSGSSYEPDYAIVDRMEIVKGPSSVIYGVSSAGGLINFVTKSATAQTPNYVSAQYGSWNSFRLEGQAAGALNQAGDLRGIGVVVREQGKSFMTDISHDSTILYGGLNWNPSSTVSAFLHGGFERHVRTAFDGTPTEEDGTPAPLPRSFFIGSKDLELSTNLWHAESDVTWHVGDALDLSLKGNIRHVFTHGAAPYSFGLDSAGNLGLAIQDFEGGLHANDYAVGGSGIYHLDGLGMSNSFVSLSAMYQDDLSGGAGGQGLFSGQYAGSDPDNPFVGSVNLAAGQAGVESAFNTAGRTGPQLYFSTKLKTLTVSAQSWLQIIDHLSVLAGASYAKPRITSEQNSVVQDYSAGSQMSYRGGLLYEFLPGANAYFSYSQSFNPQTYIDGTGAVLPPVIGNQYEAGIKFRPVNGRLLLTAAVFQIKQKNQGEFDTQIDGLDRYRAVGELTHRGLELEGVGRLSRNLQVNVGYSYLDPKVTKDSDITVVGRHEVFLPKQTASVFSTYTFNEGALQGVSLGGGARYVGPEPTAYDGSSKDIPGYAILDASAGYSRAGWTLQFNLHNFLDRRYYINNYNTLFYGNVVGAPLNASVTLRKDF
jgi:outer membrane receptor for ferric coprogen and ferric-rhodotorulic acid